MNRNAKFILAALVVIVLASAAFLLLHGASGARIAHITIDGEQIREIDLRQVWLPYTFTVEGPGGFSNTIRVEHGRICVESAGCPDQICVKQGYISDDLIPIVCLPNRLMIEITGEGGTGLDAAAG